MDFEGLSRSGSATVLLPLPGTYPCGRTTIRFRATDNSCPCTGQTKKEAPEKPEAVIKDSTITRAKCPERVPGSPQDRLNDEINKLRPSRVYGTQNKETKSKDS